MPLTAEEQAALAWLDVVFARHADARILRRSRSWVLTWGGPENHFMGVPNDTLRSVILHAYRTSVVFAPSPHSPQG